MKRWISLFLTLFLLLGLSLPASAAKAKAAVMRLQVTEGSVTIRDAAGVPVSYQKDMRLYSGYTVTTGDDGCAYILLDDEKAVKLDRSTSVLIKKSGRKLQVKLKSGQLVFNVTAPLDPGETFEIRTSSMVAGVRGSSGIVSLRETVFITGHGVVYSGGSSYAISGGEVFRLGDGVSSAGISSLPSVYLKEVRDNPQLRASIRAEGVYDADVLIAAIPAAERREDEERGAALAELRFPPENDSLQPAFNPAPNAYTVTWVSEGTVLRTDSVPAGDTPSYSGAAPTKEADSQYSYTFTGWTPEIVPAAEDTTYTAVFSAETRSYTVTWKDDEGNIIDTAVVPYGETPVHADPVKPAAGKARYTFAGWDQTPAPVTGDVTYTAVFETAYDFTAIIPGSTDTLPYRLDFPTEGNTPVTTAKAGEDFTFYLRGIQDCVILLNGQRLGEENVYYNRELDAVVCTFTVPEDPVIEIEPDEDSEGTSKKGGTSAKKAPKSDAAETM